MLSRRDLIGKAAVGAATAFALGAARTGIASVRAVPVPTDEPADDRNGIAENHDGRDASPQPAAADPSVTSAPPPWELLHPLVAGSIVANGWRVTDLSAVTNG